MLLCLTNLADVDCSQYTDCACFQRSPYASSFKRTPAVPTWSPRILHPDTFDRDFPAALPPVYACSCMMYSRFSKDRDEREMFSHHWVHRTIMRIEHPRLFRSPRISMELAAPILDTIVFNREFYGCQSGTKDALLEYPDASTDFFRAADGGHCCI